MSVGRTPAEAVQQAVAALAAGQMMVVTDDVDGENEGDLVVAAELVSEEQMAFLLRQSTGIVCAPMSPARADALRLPPMVADNTEAQGTAFTVSVDLAGTGTGVSAAAGSGRSSRPWSEASRSRRSCARGESVPRTMSRHSSSSSSAATSR